MSLNVSTIWVETRNPRCHNCVDFYHKNTTLFCPLKKDGAIVLSLRTEIVFLTTQQFQGEEWIKLGNEIISYRGWAVNVYHIIDMDEYINALVFLWLRIRDNHSSHLGWNRILEEYNWALQTRPKLPVWGSKRAILSLQTRNLSVASKPDGGHSVQVMEPFEKFIIAHWVVKYAISGWVQEW